MTANDDIKQALLALDATGVHHDVPFENGTMRWRRFGNGRPLVLVHGGHGSWLHWVRNVAALSATHEVWIPDLPGYGDSSALPRDAGVVRIVEIMVATLATLIGARTEIDLVGFSFGGVVSTRAAVARGHVRRLALLGTGGHGGPRRQVDELKQWRGLEPEATRETLRYNLAALMLHDPASIDALALEAYAQSCAATRYRSRPVSRASSINELLEPFTNPVLLVFGEHDVTTTPLAVASTLVEGHPNREAVVIEGGGHWVQYERAQAVNDALLAFMESAGEGNA
jgi:2-hydroxy-6-oxonona-2,4-dienedioate hydrolase